MAERDYSGVPTAELADHFRRYQKSTGVDFRAFAKNVGMEERELKKILISQEYAFTGLRLADRILLGMELNVSQMAEAGDIHVVCRDARTCAKQLVLDQWNWDEDERDWIEQDPPEDLEDLIDAEMARRAQYIVLTEAQVARLQADSARAARRTTTV